MGSLSLTSWRRHYPSGMLLTWPWVTQLQRLHTPPALFRRRLPWSLPRVFPSGFIIKCHQAHSEAFCPGISVRPLSNHLLSTYPLLGTVFDPETVTVNKKDPCSQGPRTAPQLLNSKCSNPLWTAHGFQEPGLAHCLRGPRALKWDQWAAVCPCMCPLTGPCSDSLDAHHLLWRR